MHWRIYCKVCEHGLKLDGIVFEMFAGHLQARLAFLAIQHPIAIEFIVVLGPLDIARSQCRGLNLVARNRRIAIEAHAVQLHHQGVARQGAFDIERAGFRVAAQRAAYPLAIHAARVHRPGAHGVAGKDVQHRRDRIGEDTVEFRGFEIVDLRRVRSNSGAFGRPGDLAAIGPDAGACEFVPVRFARKVSEMVAVGAFGSEGQVTVFERAFQFELVQAASEFAPFNLERDAGVADITQVFAREFPITGYVGGRDSAGGQEKTAKSIKHPGDGNGWRWFHNRYGSWNRSIRQSLLEARPRKGAKTRCSRLSMCSIVAEGSKSVQACQAWGANCQFRNSASFLDAVRRKGFTTLIYADLRICLREL